MGDSTKRAFKVCGANDISDKYNVKLIDLKSDATKNIEGIEICKSALELRFFDKPART